jgi:hypothetical protein
MNEEIQKFDPSTLMQGVKDRIKSTFVSLVPDGQWDTMVQKEIDAFFAEAEAPREWRGHNYSYEVKTVPSPFRKMVWDLCEQQTSRVLNEYMRERFQAKYDEAGKLIVDEVLNKLIVENAGQMFAQMIAGSIQQAMTQSHIMTMSALSNNQNRF